MGIRGSANEKTEIEEIEINAEERVGIRNY
jgi:hypothetical protein